MDKLATEDSIADDDEDDLNENVELEKYEDLKERDDDFKKSESYDIYMEDLKDKEKYRNTKKDKSAVKIIGPESKKIRIKTNKPT